MFRDWDQLIAPLVLLGIAWVIAVYQIRKGLKTGELTYFRRSSGSEMSLAAESTGICRRADEPLTFWSLFGFYVIVACGVPLLVLIVLWQRVKE